MEPSSSDEPPSSTTQEKLLNQEGSAEKHGSFFDIQVQIISDINLCFELWQEFSPKKTLFDTWEFRLAFHKAYQFKPYFILIKNQLENLALLPLEYDGDEKRYVWFGTPWQEENKFFTKNPALIPSLLSLAPNPLFLNAIDLPSIHSIGEFIDFQPDSPKYILDLYNIKTAEDFLTHLTKNKRHALRKDKRRIEKQNPKITINDSPSFSDLDNLINLSKERLKEKGKEADWEDPRRIEAFRQVILLSNKSYKLKTIIVATGSKIAGVDLVALFNNCYYTLKCGYDVKNFSGIGNFFNLFEIGDALSLGMKRVDFLQNNYAWKSRFFQALPLLQYTSKL